MVFSFSDTFSGGFRKSDFEYYLVVAESESAAITKFKEVTGCDPEEVTCQCCGSDFWICEYPSIEEYFRGLEDPGRKVKIIE